VIVLRDFWETEGRTFPATAPAAELPSGFLGVGRLGAGVTIEDGGLVFGASTDFWALLSPEWSATFVEG
jgi:hypothetical protein